MVLIRRFFNACTDYGVFISMQKVEELEEVMVEIKGQ